MERTELSIDMHSDDAALIRLLGVVRRRGFAVRSLEATDGGESGMRVSMSIESTRPVEILVRQIGRIIGVARVAVGTGEISAEMKAGGAARVA